MRLTGRTVLITGGSEGIGFELARQLIERKNVVIITGRDEAKLAVAKTQLPGLHTFRSDVGKIDDIVSLHRWVVDKFPSLDVVMNNAGIMRDIKLSQPFGLDDIVQEIEIDLNGPIWMVQQFLPNLLAKQEAAIINVSSALAFLPMPMSPIYSAAKAGLRAYTQALRVQLGSSKVRVIEILPPAVDSALSRRLTNENTQGLKLMSASTLADKTMDAIAAGQLEIVLGEAKALKILSRFAPGFGLKQLSKVSGY